MPVAKAVPVPDDVAATAGKPERDAFSPFTRMGKNDGAISREGDNAVDAAATPRGIYMRQVTGAVEKNGIFTCGWRGTPSISGVCVFDSSWISVGCLRI